MYSSFQWKLCKNIRWLFLSLGQIVAVLQGFSSKLSAGSEKPHRRVIAPLCHCGENCSGCSKHTTALKCEAGRELFLSYWKLDFKQVIWHHCICYWLLYPIWRRLDAGYGYRVPVPVVNERPRIAALFGLLFGVPLGSVFILLFEKSHVIHNY